LAQWPPRRGMARWCGPALGSNSQVPQGRTSHCPHPAIFRSFQADAAIAIRPAGRWQAAADAPPAAGPRILVAPAPAQLDSGCVAGGSRSGMHGVGWCARAGLRLPVGGRCPGNQGRVGSASRSATSPATRAVVVAPSRHRRREESSPAPPGSWAQRPRQQARPVARPFAVSREQSAWSPAWRGHRKRWAIAAVRVGSTRMWKAGPDRFAKLVDPPVPAVRVSVSLKLSLNCIHMTVCCRHPGCRHIVCLKGPAAVGQFTR